jgi:adenylate cyclase class 2
VDPVRRNLELKAPCPDLEAVRARVLALPPHAHSREEQTDTYIHVPTGRLKLREIAGSRAELIWYDRPDAAKSRVSCYQLTPVADAAGLKTLLAAALGIRGAVRKQRGIYLWQNVRIHLDRVAGLGDFIEFEAVLSFGNDLDASQSRLQHLYQQLGIDPGQAIATSYSDLLGL